ncbi:lipase [Paenibacillus thalictri]|uniref:Lipase n=2 Tax=Paenibacillus thalictri TaxID=2527873 RepID=A0A4Q9DKQ6_9BACL|nr:lipase [Paenibacillus thalictri]
MCIHEGVLFHNVSELEKRERLPGLRLQRFPRTVRESLNAKARVKAAQSNGCEIRFVTESRYVNVTVSAVESGGFAHVFRGDLYHSSHPLTAGVLHTLHLETPERLAQVSQTVLHNRAYSPDVWRIHFDRVGAVFHEVDAFGCEVRPPESGPLPKLTLLAYGSSITQAAGATNHYNGYIQQAARRLEADALNLGLSGSCYCEREIADFIAGHGGWDAAFLELGVNMRGVFTPEQYEQRASYLLDRVIAENPGKPVFITTIYPNRATFFTNPGDPLAEHERRYNDILRNYAARTPYPDLHLIEGHEIMSDFTSLTTDLIHPSDYGHMLMGEQLAGHMRPAIERLRTMQQQAANQLESDMSQIQL